MVSPVIKTGSVSWKSIISPSIVCELRTDAERLT